MAFLSAAAVAAWLTELGVTVPVMCGPIPTGMDYATPDVRILVTPAPGAGISNDGLFDTAGFQFATRGPQSRVYEEIAITVAMDADQRVRFAAPCRVGGLHVASVVRSTGPPIQVSATPAERHVYTAHYQFTYPVL